MTNSQVVYDTSTHWTKQGFTIPHGMKLGSIRFHQIAGNVKQE